MNTDAASDNTHSLNSAPTRVEPPREVTSHEAPTHEAPTHEATTRDGYRVALIKSLNTNNRFYALVSAESGIHNADAVESIPHDLMLGIAYPCLEDGLNDFAVVRTAYETLEIFPNDEAMRYELHEIITDARHALIRRLMELLERLIARKAHFLGTDLDEFKLSALEVIQRGFPRHRLDNMMKVNVFSSVAQAEATPRKASTHEEQSLYRYEFHNSEDSERLAQLSGRQFLLSLLADVLDSVMDEENYRSKYLFDRNVFQQFIALIFITYSSTDSVFYGIHKDDYGVSRDKDMDRTPLYVAIGRELRRLINMPFAPQMAPFAAQIPDSEAQSADQPNANAQMWANIAAGIFHDCAGVADATTETGAQPPEGAQPPNGAQHPNGATLSDPQPGHLHAVSPAHEKLLLGQIASICATAQQLRKRKTGDSNDLAQLILSDAAHLVEILKQINVISPLAYNPGQPYERLVERAVEPPRVLDDNAD
ncbi:MAG TPA: hypothetical protein VF600_03045 [Abditibacteriaceae bacterium]|jgi:hypothetical protein